MILNRPASLRSENNLYTYGPALFNNYDNDNDNVMTIIIKRALNLLRQLSKELSKRLTQTAISLLAIYDSFLIWGNRKSAVHGERVV